MPRLASAAGSAGRREALALGLVFLVVSALTWAVATLSHTCLRVPRCAALCSVGASFQGAMGCPERDVHPSPSFYLFVVPRSWL